MYIYIYISVATYAEPPKSWQSLKHSDTYINLTCTQKGGAAAKPPLSLLISIWS